MLDQGIWAFCGRELNSRASCSTIELLSVQQNCTDLLLYGPASILLPAGPGCGISHKGEYGFSAGVVVRERYRKSKGRRIARSRNSSSMGIQRTLTVLENGGTPQYRLRSTGACIVL